MTISNEEKRNFLSGLIEQSSLGVGEARVKRQHDQGKYTALERINRLLDPESFIEFGKFVKHNCHSFGMEETQYLGDGVVTGIGTINGQKVAIFSQDFTCWGGALGKAYAQKICKIMDFAIENKVPVIGINDSGGARIQEGVESLAGYADIFHRNVKASGVIPQISLVMGPCAGGAVYSPAMTDFVFMVDKTSYMFVTGPDVVKTVTHEEVTKDELGGAKTHNEKSGVAHFLCEDEDDCLERVRELLSFLPSGNFKKAEKTPTLDSNKRKNTKLKDFIPTNSKKPYDMKELIMDVVDDQHFLEVQKNFAKNIICGFAQFSGVKVGIIANQPQVLAGCLDLSLIHI